VLNQSEYLKRMIESVRAQALEDWELIIVDDGSTEDIAALVASFDDSRIKLHRWDENRGIPHGLNHAFGLAAGDYVQPLSADEWIDTAKLAFQVDYLDKHPEIGCVWGLPGKGQMGPRPSWEQYHLRAHNRSREAWIRTLLRFENIPIGGASMLMRRSIMQELGGFDPQFFHCSDLELFVRFFGKHEGRVLCHRWADADQPGNRLTAPSEENAKRFREDVEKLHAKHQKLVLPASEGTVTVCIPVYNMAQYIGQALDSVLAQTRPPDQIIVLDDASTDDLEKALEPYAEHITGFIKFESNMGVRHALNAMIARCETDFFVSLAADDTLAPSFLEKTLARFREDPWLEFVASQTDFMDAAGKPLAAASHDVQRIPQCANRPRETWLHLLYHGNHYFGVGVYRTHVLRELNGFDTDAGVLTDYDMYLRLLQRENICIVEEALTHTRIWDGNASVGPGKIDALWLKQKYSEIRRRYFAPRMKVILCTCFYEMKGYSPYIFSLFYTAQLLHTAGIMSEYWDLAGDSYVDRAKNTLFTKFLEDPDATDLFLIDADMQWNPDAILRMLALPEPVVVGSYPQKNAWAKWTSTPKLVQEDGAFKPVGRVLPDGQALIQAQYMAGGFVRVKRHVLEEFQKRYTEDAYLDPSADPAAPTRRYTNFFQCEVKEGLRWGEDRFFGKRLNAMGIDVFIYPNIDFGHYGVKGWHGNFDRWLRSTPEQQAAHMENDGNTHKVA
jgi:glycosyltransferase involved in cell wall biosynthesis